MIRLLITLLICAVWFLGMGAIVTEVRHLSGVKSLMGQMLADGCSVMVLHLLMYIVGGKRTS